MVAIETSVAIRSSTTEFARRQNCVRFLAGPVIHAESSRETTRIKLVFCSIPDGSGSCRLPPGGQRKLYQRDVSENDPQLFTYNGIRMAHLETYRKVRS